MLYAKGLAWCIIGFSFWLLKLLSTSNSLSCYRKKGEVHLNGGLGAAFNDFSPSIAGAVSYAPKDQFACQFYAGVNLLSTINSELSTGYLKTFPFGTVGVFLNGGVNYFDIYEPQILEDEITYSIEGYSTFFGPRVQYSYRYKRFELGASLRGGYFIQKADFNYDFIIPVHYTLKLPTSYWEPTIQLTYYDTESVQVYRIFSHTFFSETTLNSYMPNEYVYQRFPMSEGITMSVGFQFKLKRAE